MTKPMREYREFTMKRIVVATDFSDASYGAINYAKQLARCFAAKVLVVHVIDMARSLQADGLPSERLADRIDAAEDELQRIGSSLAFEGVRYSTALRVGGIREAVSELIAERDADLLVIGTSGKGYRKGEGLGSVAELLLRSVSCPVLTVGRHVHQDAYEATHERTVLFPTDFSETSRAALDYTVCLAQHLAGRLLLLHVVQPAALAEASAREKEFQRFTRNIAGSKISGCIIRSGDPAQTIVKVSEENRADFIVMGVQRNDAADIARGELFAFDVIRLAMCPVFTLSAGPKAEAIDHKEHAAARA
jgi:nucleotide-binding universal stress UspA family protein